MICLTSIPRLFFCGSPSHVARFVVTVVIDAIDRKLCVRRIAHVCKEVFKLLPSFTERNSPTAPTMESRRIRILAPRFHSRPGFINRSARLSMCTIASASQFAIQATAALNVSGKKIAASNDMSIFTFAPTQPKRIMRTLADIFKNREARKNSANEIFDLSFLWHRFNVIMN